MSEMTTATERAGVWAQNRPTPFLRQRVRDYITLTKPHIISLLLVTTLSPMIVAGSGWPDGLVVLATMIGGYLMAGSANAANMFVDRDIDAHMGRTSLRPIPAGRLSPRHVLGFSLTIGCLAFALFYIAVNTAAALLATAGWAWYVGVYTLRLKRTSPQNIVIGGAAGAFPVLVGWAAVTGGISVTAVLLFLVVFLWTPPHFWALALVKRRDYERVGVPMAPSIWGQEKTIRQMIIYAVALVVTSVVPVALGTAGLLYGVLALGLGAWFLLRVIGVARAEDLTPAAWRAYRASLLYLALLFTAIAVDALIIS